MPVSVLSFALEVHGIGDTRLAEDCAVTAIVVGAIRNVCGHPTAHITVAENSSVCAEVDGHALVKHIQRTLPQTLVAVGLAVAHDSALDLIDLGETAIEHRRAEDLASDAARAVGHDWFALEVVVFSAVEFCDEIMSRSNVGHDGVLESADTSLKCVSAIEEHDVVAALGHKVVDLSGAEMLPTVEDPRFTDDDFLGRRECYEFWTGFDAQTREIITRSFRPLHVHLPESGVLLG